MAASRKEQKDLIRQIDSIIANMQNLLLKQFEQVDGSASGYAACKQSILTAISKLPEKFYDETVKEFRKNCETNEALDVESRQEKGEILKNSIQQLERKFDPQIGDQSTYIKDALRTFLSAGANNILVNKKNIQEDSNLNAIFTYYLTLHGYLLRQKFCLEQMKKLGAQDGYAKTGPLLKKALEMDLKEINPQRIAILNEESGQFNKVWKEIIRRLKVNDNDICQPFIVPNDNSALATFIKKVNAQFYNKGENSKIPSFQFINDIHQQSLMAQKTGDEVGLQALHMKAKAVWVWMAEIEKNLKAAFQEYEHAFHQKIQEMDQNVLKDIKRSLEANDEIFKMRYVLATADLMYHTNSSDKYTDGYDLLRSVTSDLKKACARSDVAVGYTNGWTRTGQDIENELTTLIDKLLVYTQLYSDKNTCQTVAEVFNSFGQLKKTFDDQRKIPKGFEKALKSAHGQFIGTEANVSAYFSAHWYAKCQEIIRRKADGLPSFINRHWKKIAIGSGVLSLAATTLGLVLTFTSLIIWPLVIPVMLAGLVVGGLIGAMVGGFLDKYCRAESMFNKLSVMEAGRLLGLGDETRQQLLPRSSSAVAFQGVGAHPQHSSEIELDTISNMLNEATDSFKPEVILENGVKSDNPSPRPPAVVANYNPFA